jgi:hypothetical protein
MFFSVERLQDKDESQIIRLVSFCDLSEFHEKTKIKTCLPESTRRGVVYPCPYQYVFRPFFLGHQPIQLTGYRTHTSSCYIRGRKTLGTSGNYLDYVHAAPTHPPPVRETTLRCADTPCSQGSANFSLVYDTGPLSRIPGSPWSVAGRIETSVQPPGRSRVLTKKIQIRSDNEGYTRAYSLSRWKTPSD